MAGNRRRIHLWMDEYDLERIHTLWPWLDRSRVVQTVMHKYLNMIEAKAQQSHRRPSGAGEGLSRPQPDPLADLNPE
jgi:hypothetical protein